jgi:hypothetical protein
MTLMTTRAKVSKFACVAAASTFAVMVAANAGSALAHDDHHHSGDANNSSGTTSKVTVHGPGSSHNPIVYHPVHGPGSSHNPIVNKSGNTLAPGTVVRDHRNGKTCEYTVGDANSIRAYNLCEYGSGGHH